VTAFVAVLSLGIGTASGAPVKEIFPQWLNTMVAGERIRVPYVSSHPLSTRGTELKRLVILIHGAGRSKVTFERVFKAAQTLGVAEQTLILQPQFLVLEDIEAFDLTNDVLFWGAGWREGDRSHRGTDAHPKEVRLSSFTLVDQLIQMLVNNNSSISEVVVAGHSAGGQYSQRYAAGSVVEQSLGSHVSLRYLVANPSSYVYLNKNRPVPGSLTEFATPNNKAWRECPDYNDYKFGLKDLNTYMRASRAKKIRKQFGARDVRYLLGAKDNDTGHDSLSRRCESNLQGPHRLARGLAFYNYLGEQYGPSIYERHRLVVVPNVGHTSSIYTSECGLNYLFDVGVCDAELNSQ